MRNTWLQALVGWIRQRGIWARVSDSSHDSCPIHALQCACVCDTRTMPWQVWIEAPCGNGCGRSLFRLALGWLGWLAAAKGEGGLPVLQRCNPAPCTADHHQHGHTAPDWSLTHCLGVSPNGVREMRGEVTSANVILRGFSGDTEHETMPRKHSTTQHTPCGVCGVLGCFSPHQHTPSKLYPTQCSALFTSQTSLQYVLPCVHRHNPVVSLCHLRAQG